MVTYFFGVIKQYTTLVTQLQMSSFKQFHVFFFPELKLLLLCLVKRLFS